jgi:hypothetical protein
MPASSIRCVMIELYVLMFCSASHIFRVPMIFIYWASPSCLGPVSVLLRSLGLIVQP